MTKKPNASNLTHGLAELGGGAKSKGGGGMPAGMQNIFQTGVKVGIQQSIGTNQTTESIGVSTFPHLSDTEGEE